MSVKNSREMLQEYLDNVLENVVRGEYQVGRDKNDKETRFYFGSWQVSVSARLRRFGESPTGRPDYDQPGILVILENFLYGHGSGTLEYYFPIADPKCGEHILKTIDSVRDGRSPWTFSPS